MNKRNEWFYNARWGICMHFLAISASTSDTSGLSSRGWNRRVNAFDVKILAAQLAEIKAGYLLLTIGQNSGYYCSPNSYYDRQVGPGFCSERDLPAELLAALEPYGIPLLTYLPSGAPSGDINALRALDGIPPWDSSAWGAMNADKLAQFATDDHRLRQFQHHWQEIIREWSLRWKKGVKGWWFDGCYFADKMYNFPEAPNFTSFAATARAGNPDAILAFNAGVKYPPLQISSEEDYTAGEINNLWEIPQTTGANDYSALYHTLTFAGEFWGSGTMRYSPGEMAAATGKVLNRGGVVTWDIPFNQQNGTINPDDLATLGKFSRMLPEQRDNLPLPDARIEIITPPQRIWPENRQIQGHGLLSITNSTPRKRCWQLKNLPVTLEPGEQRQLEIPLPSTMQSGNSAYCLESAHFRRTFSLTPDTTVHVSEEFRVLPEIKYMDVSIGSLELAFSGSALHLRGNIFDEKISQSAIPWMNSCIELFFVNGSGVEQYFLAPADGINADHVSKMPGYTPVPEILFRTTPRAEAGYHFEVSLPQQLTGISSGVIRMEIKLNVHNRHGFMQGLLFGVEHFRQVDKYKGRLLIGS